MADDVSMDIEYVAHIARVSLSDEEKSRFASQLKDVLEHFKKLQQVDVDGVEPIAHPFDLNNVWREDDPGETWGPDIALKNAPAQRDGQVVVPKVVEDA
mgnify:CR=1 FL=1